MNRNGSRIHFYTINYARGGGFAEWVNFFARVWGVFSPILPSVRVVPAALCFVTPFPRQGAELYQPHRAGRYLQKGLGRGRVERLYLFVWAPPGTVCALVISRLTASLAMCSSGLRISDDDLLFCVWLVPGASQGGDWPRAYFGRCEPTLLSFHYPHTSISTCTG